MSHVYLVIVQHYQSKEVVAVCKLRRDADAWAKVERDNYQASGGHTFEGVIVEKWEITQ